MNSFTFTSRGDLPVALIRWKPNKIANHLHRNENKLYRPTCSHQWEPRVSFLLGCSVLRRLHSCDPGCRVHARETRVLMAEQTLKTRSGWH